MLKLSKAGASPISSYRAGSGPHVQACCGPQPRGLLHGSLQAPPGVRQPQQEKQSPASRHRLRGPSSRVDPSPICTGLPWAPAFPSPSLSRLELIMASHLAMLWAPGAGPKGPKACRSHLLSKGKDRRTHPAPLARLSASQASVSMQASPRLDRALCSPDLSHFPFFLCTQLSL